MLKQKLCVECKFYLSEEYFYERGAHGLGQVRNNNVCRREKTYHSKTNVVTGDGYFSEDGPSLDCVSERSDVGECGPDGLFFEGKEEMGQTRSGQQYKGQEWSQPTLGREGWDGIVKAFLISCTVGGLMVLLAFIALTIYA